MNCSFENECEYDPIEDEKIDLVEVEDKKYTKYKGKYNRNRLELIED
jgi:hypothetical protein